jgi:hypothetical protein
MLASAGYGYEITGVDVLAACSSTLAAARNGGCMDEIEGRIRSLIIGPGLTAMDLIAASLGTPQRDLLTVRLKVIPAIDLDRHPGKHLPLESTRRAHFSIDLDRLR